MWPTFSNFLRLFLSLVQRILQHTEPLTDAISIFTTQVFKVLYSHCTGERTPQVKKKSGPISMSRFQEKDVDVTSLETTHPNVSDLQTLPPPWLFVRFLPTQRWLHMEWGRGQRTHRNMWTLRASLVSIQTKILNLSLKALKDRFSTTKIKNVLFLYIIISHRERHQIFTQEVTVCKCSQIAWKYEKWDWVMKAAKSKVYSRNMSPTLSSYCHKPEESTVSRPTPGLLQPLD